MKVDIAFFLYPFLLAATLGLWWLPFFLWKENEHLKKIAGILLWWVNIPLYCLVLGPALEKQPSLQEVVGYPWMYLVQAIGAAMIVWAVAATLLFLIPRWKAGGPGYKATKLQIQGIFGIVRHPQLSSAWFLAAGFCLLQGATYGLISTLLFLLVLWGHAWMEEKYLLIPTFGEDYLEYRKQVKAFIPFLI